MPAYAINEGTFQLPEGWEDKSVTALAFPAGAPIPSASLAVTRDPIHGDAVLSKYVDEQVAKLAKSCGSFQLIQRRTWRLSGEAAELLEFTWKTPEAVAVRQLMAASIWRNEVLVITATSTIEKFPEYQPVFEQILESFRVQR